MTEDEMIKYYANKIVEDGIKDSYGFSNTINIKHLFIFLRLNLFFTCSFPSINDDSLVSGIPNFFTIKLTIF